MKICKLIFLILCVETFILPLWADLESLSPKYILEEVSVKVNDTKPLMWDTHKFHFHLSHIQAQEKNLFSSYGFEVAGAYRFSFALLELGLRYFVLEDTSASLTVGSWPIKQYALPSRFEMYLGYEFIAIQGRGKWFFTNYVGDIEQYISVLPIISSYYYNPWATPPVLLMNEFTLGFGLELAFRWTVLSSSGFRFLTGYSACYQSDVATDLIYMFNIGIGYEL